MDIERQPGYRKVRIKRTLQHCDIIFPGLVLCAFCFGLGACIKNAGKDAADNSPKFRQYYNQGEQLYAIHCSNCHQKDGTGLGRVYPPLKGSDYMAMNFEDVICLIRFGKKGEIIVNGRDYNQPMPGIPVLTDLEIAEIATYIYNAWDKKRRGIVEVKVITPILEKCQ